MELIEKLSGLIMEFPFWVWSFSDKIFKFNFSNTEMNNCARSFLFYHSHVSWLEIKIQSISETWGQPTFNALIIFRWKRKTLAWLSYQLKPVTKNGRKDGNFTRSQRLYNESKYNKYSLNEYGYPYLHYTCLIDFQNCLIDKKFLV